MRTVSDFDRPYPGEAATTNLFYAEQGAFEPAVKKLYLAGVKVIEGILEGWNGTFKRGVEAGNYVGDIFGTLGGMPDFGPYARERKQVLTKRSAKARRGGVKIRHSA